MSPSAASLPSALTAVTPAVGRVPPLENGDRLTRAEFERRYALMPGVNKAELIEGVVYMPSPVSLVRHARPHSDLMAWLGFYRAHTLGVDGGDNATVRLDLDNEPQPDAVLFWNAARGGQTRITDDGYLEGPPELVAEVAASSVSIDLHAKLRVYRRNAVQEYLVWRVQDQAVDWFELREGDYQPLAADAAGILRSVRFPGLWLDSAALLRGDLAAVLQTLQRGLQARDEHAPAGG
jgi:Uma2 family endonuclease